MLVEMQNRSGVYFSKPEKHRNHVLFEFRIVFNLLLSQILGVSKLWWLDCAISSFSLFFSRRKRRKDEMAQTGYHCKLICVLEHLGNCPQS